MQKNQTLKEAWTEGEENFKAFPQSKKGRLRQKFNNDNQIIAAIAYTLETPGYSPMYSNFNVLTRNNSLRTDYNYDSFYCLLYRAVTGPGNDTPKTDLYRENSGRFTTVEGMCGCFRSFTSTTSEMRVAKTFMSAPQSSTLFRIINASSLSLKDLSAFPQEEEFLLCPYDLYRVDRIEDEQNGLRVITLTGIDTTATVNGAHEPFYPALYLD